MGEAGQWSGSRGDRNDVTYNRAVMRRFLFLFLSLSILIVACGREQRRRSAPPSAARSTVAPSTNVPVPPPPPHAAVHSTPTRCGGDGSYQVAIDCFRQTSGFHFLIADGDAQAVGEMARAAVGAESVRFRLTGSGANDGNWIGVSKGTSISWSRDGKHVTAEPPVVDRVYQRTTLSFDPQKKEGAARLEGTERVDGTDTNHYRFTDANNGDTHDFWIDRATGNVVKMKVVPSAAFRATRHDFTMSLTNVGVRRQIDAPH